MYAAWRPFFCQCKYLLKAAEAGAKKPRPRQIWHIPLPPSLCSARSSARARTSRRRGRRGPIALLWTWTTPDCQSGPFAAETHYPLGEQAELRRSASNENGAEKIIGSERVKKSDIVKGALMQMSRYFLPSAESSSESNILKESGLKEGKSAS